MRDHYVGVATDQGVETFLLRFSDALGEFGGFEGMHVLRSHWVAREAIVRTCHENGKFNSILKNKASIPVIRAYQKRVEQDLLKI